MSPRSILPVELRGITCRFGRNAVLRGVDLEVRAGEIVGLLGANGAGKTTLFSILVGLRQPDTGARVFGAREASDVDPSVRDRIAWLAHQPQLYPQLTARENVELFVELAGREGVDVAGMLARLGLAAVVDELAQTFSRGMAQRVALARALAASPELLILDEPFTALDRAGQALLVELLREQSARGAGVLLSSHDFDLLARLVDRAVLLERGVIRDRAERRDGESTEGFRARLNELGASQDGR